MERKRNRFSMPCISRLACLMNQRYLRYPRHLSLSFFIPQTECQKLVLATIAIRRSCESRFEVSFFSLLSSRRKIAMYNSGSDAARHVRKLEHGELISSFELSMGSGNREGEALPFPPTPNRRRAALIKFVSIRRRYLLHFYERELNPG